MSNPHLEVPLSYPKANPAPSACLLIIKPPSVADVDPEANTANLSSIVKLVVSIVVVVPGTVKFPPAVKSEETINEPVIRVLLVVATKEPVVANILGSVSVPVTSPADDEA